MRWLSLIALCALSCAPRVTQAAEATADSLAPQPARADSLVGTRWAELVPGARVRVRSASLGGRPLAGRVVALAGDTLRFTPDGSAGTVTRTLLDERTKVDVSVAHSSYLGRGILMGGLGGGGIGAMIVSQQQAANDIGEGLATVLGGQPQHRDVSSAPIIIGAGIGALLGGMIGNGMNVDTWVPLHRPAVVSFGGSCDPSGRSRLTLTLTLFPERTR